MSMTTDKQALRDNANSIIGILENIAGFEPSDIDGDNVELRFEGDDGVDTGCDVSIVDQCQKAADVMRSLLDELEAAQHEKDELRQGFIANQEEAHEAIKYATELKEQLARACAGREEAFREVDEMQKSLDHTHRRRAIWRGRAEDAEAKLEAAEKRIAELEARTLTVKLPDEAVDQVCLAAAEIHNRGSGVSDDKAQFIINRIRNYLENGGELKAAGIALDTGE